MAKLHNCYASYYYLCYYSLFHAMLSALYLVPSIKIENLIEIKHDKLHKNFVNNFRPKNFPILSSDIDRQFTLLKSYREYYSYTMPMNEFFQSLDIETPEKFLGKSLRECYQLTSLHSLILFNSNLSVHIESYKIKPESWYYFEEWFNKVNARVHPFKKYYILDPADENIKNDIYNWGFGIGQITTDLDHFLDEFKTYQHDYENKNGVDDMRIWGLIYSSLRK